MSLRTQIPIHLWVYNHLIKGINDQIDFVLTAFNQAGYHVTLSRKPNPKALNLVIENFSAGSRDVLLKFCQSHQKRVAVIMTEHIDFELDKAEIYIHGAPLLSDNDYMHPVTQFLRLQHLLECLPYLRGFIALGDLPELKNMSHFLPGVSVRRIPFPKILPVENKTHPTTYDLIFTGMMTAYRANVCEGLKADAFSFSTPSELVSKKRRHLLNTSGKLIINIPQRATWHWLSTMRIIAGLCSGRATVSLGTQDTSQISQCCIQLDIEKNHWQRQLRTYVHDWQKTYQNAYESYSNMAKTFEVSNPFPHDFFDFWAITDRI